MPEYNLMDHQTKGVEFIEQMDGVAALLYEPGVGKTGTTLTWVDRQARKHGEFRVLVVGPKTAADTWALQAPPFMDAAVKARVLAPPTSRQLTQLRAAREWATVPETPIMVNHRGDARKNIGRVTIMSMSAGAVSSFCSERSATVKMIQAVRKYAPHLIVVDESQIIKSPTSNVSKAMYQLGQLVPHRIILTGTVNPKDALDCYGQWRFLAPWTFSAQADEEFTKKPHLMTRAQTASIKPWTWKQFSTRYGEFGGHGGASVVGANDEFLGDLHRRVAQRSQVVLKADALDLPPTTDIDVHVTLSPVEQRAYDQMRDDLATMLANGELIEAPNALSKIMKLRQIAAGFVKDTETDTTHVIGKSLQDAVREIVNVNLGDQQRTVVFAYFKSECAMLAHDLKMKGRTVEVVTGATSQNERLAIRRRFKDVSGNPEQTVLVAQARTMSLSVNELVTAQNAVYASMSERRDDWVQSRGRLDRQGQTLPVTFWNVYAPGTVGQVMLETHKRRGSLEQALFDYIRNTPR